jgi:ATP synthase protein I
MANPADRPVPKDEALEDRALAERLKSLGDKLHRVEVEEKKAETAARGGADPTSLAKAMRLSSEFIAGIVAGGLIGWLTDHFLGTSPWGMIVFVMLGFGAGLMNLMRSSGMLPTKPKKP